MSYEAIILEDSVSKHTGKRITTAQLTFPRFILAEVNTHCRFSRNSASSRAIPTEKQIEMIVQNPFVPIFNKRVKGMGVGEYLEGDEKEEAEGLWLQACNNAILAAEQMLHVDKSRVNRLLEPFAWHTAIITSTEWENYNALRIPPGNEVDLGFPAQPEFQKIGLLHRAAHRNSDPRTLDYGEWHLPLVPQVEGLGMEWEYLCQVSAGRCARVSYITQGQPEEMSDSVRRADTLTSSGHMSPFMHQARPMEPSERFKPWLRSNFEDWVQLRKLIPNESNAIGVAEERFPFDPRFPDSYSRS